jgi:hypothetical protein
MIYKKNLYWWILLEKRQSYRGAILYKKGFRKTDNAVYFEFTAFLNKIKK